MDDIYDATASACFTLASNCVRTVAPNRLTYRQQKRAESEVVCLLLHFLSRLMLDDNPGSFNDKMSALATAALQRFTQDARDAFVWTKVEDHMAKEPPDYGANNKVVTREQYKHALFGLYNAFADIPERPHLRQELNSITGKATEMFMNLYFERTEEYGSLEKDWFRLLLVKFGKHFCEAVAVDDDLQVFFNTQSQAVQMFDALGDYVPQLLAARAT